MVNDCTFIGNLGKDPEVKTTENGHKVARFPIACGEKVKKPETGETVEYTEWVNIILWDKLADVAEQYLKKGMQVYVHGRMRTRSYEGNDKITRYVTEIHAFDMKMLGRKTEKAPMPESPFPAGDAPRQESAPEDKDDLPF